MSCVRQFFLFAAIALATGIAGAQSQDPYAKVEPGYEIHFPADEGSHPQFRTEWWYLTGWLRDERGVERGFQLTFFRSRSAQADANPSRFAPRQLLFAHAALSDPGIGHLLHAQRTARAGFGLAQAEEGSTNVVLDDWSLRQSAQSYAVKLGSEEFDLNLSFAQTQPPLLRGENGYSQKSPDDSSLASYYYSLPQLRVQGEISVKGRVLRVTGEAWFDHEWFHSLLDERTVGWDWMGINLLGGGVLSASRVRDAQGNSRWSSSTQRLSDKPLCPKSSFAKGAVINDTSVWQELRHWRSPRTGITYPVEWRVAIGSCAVILRPLFDDQESDSRGSTGTIYWEGAVQAFDEAGALLGSGYLELTGYGSRLRL